MMKKLFGASDTKAVDSLSQTMKNFNYLFTIYEQFQKLMELSAYSTVDEEGRRVREMFPPSTGVIQMSTFEGLRDKFKEARKMFKDSQILSQEEYKKQLGFPPSMEVKMPKKDALYNCWPGSPQDKQVKSVSDKVEHICTTMNLRVQFEAQLFKYSVARYNFEARVTKIEVLLELAGLDLEPVVNKTQRDFAAAFKLAFETARSFNSLCLWSVAIRPHPEYVGHYSWYSLYNKEGLNKGTIEYRRPWHQFVDEREAMDIFHIFGRLAGCANAAQQIGIELDIEEIKAQTELLKPSEGHTLEGTKVLFPLLYQRDLEAREEGDSEPSLAPSQTELDILAGDWLKKVAWKSKEESDKEEEDDNNVSHYFDAEQKSTSPPLGSSPKKKPVKVHKKMKTESTGSSEDDSVFSSVSKHSISSSCSPEQLKKKAEKKIKRLVKELKVDELSEEHLKTLKFDANSMSKKIDMHGDAEDDDLNFLVDKLENLIMRIDTKLEAKKVFERKTRQLPRGKLLTWDGSCENYLDFKRQMDNFLLYDCEYLNLSTLKDQIRGKEKNHILDLLQNVEDKAEAFAVLDVHFGNIRTVLPRMRAKLDKLSNYPTAKDEQVKNIQHILNYYKTAKQYDIHERSIDFDFIREYSSLLSMEQKMIIIDLEIDSCAPFIAKIKRFQRNNLEFLHSSKAKPSTTFQNVNRPGGGAPEGLGPDSTTGMKPALAPPGRRPPHQAGSRFRKPGQPPNYGRSPIKCFLCEEKHPSYHCPLLTLEPDVNKVKNAITEKDLCDKCLSKKHTDGCRNAAAAFLCTKHGANRLICKCPDSKWKPPNIQQNSTNIVNQAILGSVGFDSELVVIRNGSKQRQVLLTYDSYASHTTLHKDLQEELCLEKNSVGDLEIQTYAGSIQEEGFMVTASIDGLKPQKIDFLISKHAQKMPVCQYSIPEPWIKKYNLAKYPTSASGLNMITVGKDQCSLFPVQIETVNGVAVSKSSITGNHILSGRALSTSDTNPMANRTIIASCKSISNELTAFSNSAVKTSDNSQKKEENHWQVKPLGAVNINTASLGCTSQSNLLYNEVTPKIAKTQSLQISPGHSHLAKTWTEPQDLILKELSTDSINVHPIKRCMKCSNCKECKKAHLPCQTRQIEQAQIVKDSLTFADGQYTAEYPYNGLLSQLETNEGPCMRMMKSLEMRLKKENLTEAFNLQVEDFFKRGVIKWVTDVPGIEKLQQSFIPLTYALKSGVGVTTKLRICGNSSFKSRSNISLNDCMIPGPKYLHSIEGILLRFRVANEVALGDIKNCYHKINSGAKDASLRRIYIKPEGMGVESSPWREACFTVVSFGDVLGGATAQTAIQDCGERFITSPTRKAISDSIYMDDLMIGTKGKIDEMILEADQGLRKGNFIVKQWIKIGDDAQTKFLSYTYHAKEDKISVRPRINWSPKKRGTRKDADCQTLEECHVMSETYGLTKRTVASILMGTVHDPLGLILPYINNLKLIYRDICRQGIEWDQPINENLKARIMDALSLFVNISTVQFHRKVIFPEAQSITFKIYFDGSLSAVGVSVVCLSELPNGKRIFRLLCNKNKILGNDITTAPRSELCACLISTRVYTLITEQLAEFLKHYKGKVRFQILGDSLIVLNQIKRNSYNFATFAASRIQEIKENTDNYDVSWHHVASADNVSDILTRQCFLPPSELPWTGESMVINEECLQTSVVNIRSLPDTDKKNILANTAMVPARSQENGQNISSREHSQNIPSLQAETPDLATLMLYTELRRQTCTGQSEHKPNELIQGLLRTKSSYFIVKNIMTRIIELHPTHKKKNLAELSCLAEDKIFIEFQKQANDYTKNFRGNNFYTFTRNDVLMIKGRETIHGATEYKLVPTKSLLYDRIAATFHRKYHFMAGSPVFIRAQLLNSGYYLPHAVKRLKSLQDRCPRCRARIKKELHTAMGQVGDRRLSYSAPFTSLQSDLIGPYHIKEYFNSRGTRKLWIMVSVCNFSRYISLTPVESLSKESIINSFENHFHRFGRSVSVETDMGTNFTAAKQTLQQQNENEVMIDKDDMKQITQSLKSAGVALIQRAAKSPWIQGSVERANGLVKRIFPEKRLTVFQTVNLIEYIQFIINQRPIGTSNVLECVKPADVIPVWSKIQPCSMGNCAKEISSAMNEFREKWKTLYESSILTQKKWMDSNHNLEVGDIVLINDLRNNLNYPKHGKVSRIEEDSSGIERYFHIIYKIGNKEKSVKRSAPSLTLILKKSEDVTLADSLFWCPNEVTDTVEKRKRIKVTIDSNAHEISDL